MAILGAFILIVIIGVLTLFCLWDKRECFYLFNFVFKHFLIWKILHLSMNSSKKFKKAAQKASGQGGCK